MELYTFLASQNHPLLGEERFSVYSNGSQSTGPKTGGSTREPVNRSFSGPAPDTESATAEAGPQAVCTGALQEVGRVLEFENCQSMSIPPNCSVHMESLREVIEMQTPRSPLPKAGIIDHLV